MEMSAVYQDERLMIYMPEVTVLVFFLSANARSRQPATSAARAVLDTTQSPTVKAAMRMQPERALYIRPYDWPGRVASSPLCRSHKISSKTYSGRDRQPRQRAVDPSLWFAFDKQVRAWATAVSLTHRSVGCRLVVGR